MIDDQAGRILALESALADTQRSLTAHDLMLRAVLTHLALSDPQGFDGLRAGLAKAETYRSQGLSGAMTADVAEALQAMVDEVQEGIARR